MPLIPLYLGAGEPTPWRWQVVEVHAIIDPAWEHGTRLQVYNDLGSGTIIEGHPLLPEMFDPFADTPEPLGYGEGEYGDTPYGDVTESSGEGYGQDAYGDDEYGGGVVTVAIPVRVPDTYRVDRFAVKAFDRGGNPQTTVLTESVVVLSGRTPKKPAASSYTVAAQVATFTFAEN